MMNDILLFRHLHGTSETNFIFLLKKISWWFLKSVAMIVAFDNIPLNILQPISISDNYTNKFCANLFFVFSV